VSNQTTRLGSTSGADGSELGEPGSRRTGVLRAAVLAACVGGLSFGAPAGAQQHVIANNTSRMIALAEDLGSEDPTKTIDVTFWLKPQASQETIDAAVQRLYTPGSVNFHQWMTAKDVAAAVAPDAGRLARVRKFLKDNNLTANAIDAQNLYVRASGSVRDVQAALHVELHQFQRNGATFRANTSDPSIDEPVGSMIAAVGGLTERKMVPHARARIDPDTGAPYASRPLTVSANGAFFSAQCLQDGVQTVTATTAGGLPSATYTGNRYGQDITNTALGTLAPCGYQPSDVQTAYGLTDLYAKGWDGTGQTIVIVDAYGSPTIAQDAELFSEVYGLPDLTPANFTVYYPGGAPAAPDTGWAGETSLDVEWAHAIAPKAKIALVIAPTNNDSDLQAAVAFAINNHLGFVISNSYGGPEADDNAAGLDAWNNIARLGAAQGISVNYSSGDGGDSNFDGVSNVFGPSDPADGTWATGVGGTSLFLNAKGKIELQTGWGTNITKIFNAASAGGAPLVPPLNEGFLYGAGGGTSTYFKKPSFQSGLPGKYRQVPDIAYIADPYTGVEFICDAASCGDPGSGPQIGVIGGTSLAAPTFSALWAIANQANGYPLGQAAQTLYSISNANAITDITPEGSSSNVTGVITAATGKTKESAAALAAPVAKKQKLYYTALYNSPFSTSWFVLMFGTDSSLYTDWGWDNVTGLGAPNGLPFVNAVIKIAGKH
jgi:subtilase family serine protease